MRSIIAIDNSAIISIISIISYSFSTQRQPCISRQNRAQPVQFDLCPPPTESGSPPQNKRTNRIIKYSLNGVDGSDSNVLFRLFCFFIWRILSRALSSTPSKTQSGCAAVHLCWQNEAWMNTWISRSTANSLAMFSLVQNNKARFRFAFRLRGGGCSLKQRLGAPDVRNITRKPTCFVCQRFK